MRDGGGANCCVGVDTVRLVAWEDDSPLISTLLGGGAPPTRGGRGGAGGGGWRLTGSTTVCGLEGKAGGSARGRVEAGILAVPFVSGPLLLPASEREWWRECDGGSTEALGGRVLVRVGVVAGGGPRNDLAAGRLGRAGGSSVSGLLAVVGGLLKGECLSGVLTKTGSSLGALSTMLDRRLPGFSARFTGGGAGLPSRSLRISEERRGGGGDGG